MPTARHMTRPQYRRLQNERATLRSRRHVDVGNDLINYPTNSTARRRARHARIREIEDQLTNAVVDGTPPGDAVAGAGMAVTVHHDRSGEIETFLLGRGGAPDDAGLRVYSMASPLGSLVAGARPGEQRSCAFDDWHLRVTLLDVMTYEHYAAVNTDRRAWH